MTQAAKAKPTAKQRKDKVVKEIGEFFEKQLKLGTKPWNKPWDVSKCSHALPHNIVSQKPYRGVNVWILAFTGDQEFASFKQWAELGRKHAIANKEYEWRQDRQGKQYKSPTTYYGVQKGQTAHTIVYFSMIRVENDKYPAESDDKYVKIPMLKYHKVFGRSQTNLPMPEVDHGELNMTKRERAVENFMFANYFEEQGIDVRWGGTRAYYNVSSDFIGMPDRVAFKDGFAMLPTLLHEAIHSTGHMKRLSRKFGIFGDKDYAFEELVAEMGASILCRWFNILPGDALEEGLENQASYVKNWLERLKSDPGFIIKAGAKAQKAVDYILQTKFGEEDAPQSFDEEEWHLFAEEETEEE